MNTSELEDLNLNDLQTKQQVAQQFKIVPRTVQNRISKWRIANDPRLSHTVYATRDGEKYLGTEVTDDLISRLNNAGRGGQWYFEPEFAEQEFSKKDDEQIPDATEIPEKPPGHTAGGGQPGGRASSGSTDSMYLPDDVEYLKERIRTLEKEKGEEILRNEKRESNLFAQLGVKDKQISAWDEVTQGITKGLATGQLAPTGGKVPSEQKAPTGNGIVPAVVVPEPPKREPQDAPEKPAPPAPASKGKEAAKEVKDTGEQFELEVTPLEATAERNDKPDNEQASSKERTRSKAVSKKKPAATKTTRQVKKAVPAKQAKATPRKAAPKKQTPKKSEPPTLGERFTRFFR